MKFIKYLESMIGIGIYPMISLIIFFGFFTLMFLYVFRTDKNKIKEMKNIPLNDDNL